ncbi:hypothetical protein Nepgr_003958 [Nepenthes gracilis]|uniref:Uncharacterized protein n=1 Tax=Nepenthes gracilis TaxID=150966 RepID=A0AAD3S0K9_NEPGR|nr:hypothetical protein Nepgr_003958 [Nepenthes gracilis]
MLPLGYSYPRRFGHVAPGRCLSVVFETTFFSFLAHTEDFIVVSCFVYSLVALVLFELATPMLLVIMLEACCSRLS